MSMLSWGKPRIIVRSLTGADGTTNNNPYIEFPTPAEGSTALDTTKGDKVEAKVEGGENEDVRYNKSTYALNLNVRAAKGRKQPIADVDGIVVDEYEVYVQPEDPDGVAMFIPKSKVSVNTTFSVADGFIWEYAFDALKPEEGKQVRLGTIAITGTGESMNVAFTETGQE